MNITRRSVILGSAALAGTLPLRSLASVELGNLKIDTLSDGHLTLPAEMILASHVGDAEEILARYGLGTDQFTPDCNVTLLRDGTNTVLFDVGSGGKFMPSAGGLLTSLETLGVAPEDVTHVVFTHAHPDHLWGVLDDFDEPTFYNATHLINRVERDYWLDPTTPDTIGQERLAFAAGAIRNLNAIEGVLETFENGDEIISGVAAYGTYGHTPGHTSFEVRGGSESLLIVGDAIGNHHVGFERPEWESGSDQDQEMGIATRQQMLDRLTHEHMAMIGYHFPFPGVGRADRSGDAYRFVAG